ncbi:hypothetical protein SPBRAN_1142 [uncultured Candidatus Thioglobus sp.]|nr:hypothetical protein SPBRAN_1142 [uncultured Candidatus Thioglobus sp.]
MEKLHCQPKKRQSSKVNLYAHAHKLDLPHVHVHVAVNMANPLSEVTVSTQDFGVWVKDQGGSDQFLIILKEFGFNSKLSLGNLKLDSPDGEELLQRFNAGQRCVLRGLIDLAGSKPSSSNYAGCMKQVEKVRKKTELPAMRAKINQLFNFNKKSNSPAGPSNSGGNSGGNSDDDFMPQASYRPLKKRKSSKGKETPGKRTQMKKVQYNVFIIMPAQ